MKAVIVSLTLLVASVAGIAIWLMKDTNENFLLDAPSSLPVKGRMPSLENATAWLNSEPLTASTLRGKVVLVEFWTYSCINWRRQLPYVRAWADKYRDKGLVVVGIHTPEFPFEKNLDNIRWAISDMKVNYPVAVDNDYAVWDDFANNYWPALYFVDAAGNIRHHRFGEGDYDRSERVIQQLLKELGHDDVDAGLVNLDPVGAEADADWSDLHSPETYLGSARTTNFASSSGGGSNDLQSYQFPSKLELFEWALSGEWKLGHEATTLTSAPGAVRIRFHARDVHLVMGPAVAGTPIRFRVLINGKPPGNSHGVDIDEQGKGTIVEPRMYQLIRQSKPITGHEFEIEFLDPGVEIFSFTFG